MADHALELVPRISNDEEALGEAEHEVAYEVVDDAVAEANDDKGYCFKFSMFLVLIMLSFVFGREWLVDNFNKIPLSLPNNNDNNDDNDDNSFAFLVENNHTFFAFNNGPFPKIQPAEVTFYLRSSGNVSASSSYVSTDFRMFCCDNYTLEMTDLPSNVTHVLDLSSSIGNPCADKGWCQFNWNVSSGSGFDSFSFVSNVTTFSLSNSTKFIPGGMQYSSNSRSVWGCNETSLWTPDIHPWSSFAVGTVLVSEYNVSDYVDLLQSTGDNFTSCDAIYRRIDGITGQGTGVLWFNTSKIEFEDAFDDFELDWQNALAGAEILPVANEVQFNTSDNASDIHGLHRSLGWFDGSLSFTEVFPFQKKIEVEMHVNFGATGGTLGALIEVDGGFSVSGSYQRSSSGSLATFTLELLDTEVVLRSYFEADTSITGSKTVSLRDITLFRAVVFVALIPLNVEIKISPSIFLELHWSKSPLLLLRRVCMRMLWLRRPITLIHPSLLVQRLIIPWVRPLQVSRQAHMHVRGKNRADCRIRIRHRLVAVELQWI